MLGGGGGGGGGRACSGTEDVFWWELISYSDFVLDIRANHEETVGIQTHTVYWPVKVCCSTYY